MTNKNSLFAVISITALLAPALFAETYIYSNVTNDLGTSLSYGGNNVIEAGDQLAFAGTDRFLTIAQFDIYNESLSNVLSSATLRLYHVSGNTLGSLIGSFTLAPDTYLAGEVATLVFSVPYVQVADDMVWTLAFSSNALGLNYYDAPTIGTSSGTQAWWDTGSGLASVDFIAGGENYNAQFGAEAETPEPSTWILAGGSLLLVAWRKRALRAKSSLL